MTDPGEIEGLSSTQISRTIKASAETLYSAFLDPAALVQWLPPGEMTGQMHEFDASIGGGYRMSLFYPPTESRLRGKTTEREDMLRVRFVELSPPRRIVQAVTFCTADPALFGEMTMAVTFEAAAGGTEVTLLFENLPPGLDPADNDAGAAQSLRQLAQRYEIPA